MTDKVNPSINRPAEAFKTAGAIAYAGGRESGFVVDSDSTTEISIQDGGITEDNLNAFNWTTTNLDVTFDGGEAFIFGSWVAIDTQTTVTLADDTTGQTVYVGWNKDGTDDVIIGLQSAFDNASGNTDQKIPISTFDTASGSVTASTDERTIGGDGSKTLDDDTPLKFGDEHDFEQYYDSGFDELVIEDAVNNTIKQTWDKNGDVHIPNGALNFRNSNNIEDAGTAAIEFNGNADVTVPNTLIGDDVSGDDPSNDLSISGADGGIPPTSGQVVSISGGDGSDASGGSVLLTGGPPGTNGSYGDVTSRGHHVKHQVWNPDVLGWDGSMQTVYDSSKGAVQTTFREYVDVKNGLLTVKNGEDNTNYLSLDDDDFSDISRSLPESDPKEVTIVADDYDLHEAAVITVVNTNGTQETLDKLELELYKGSDGSVTLIDSETMFNVDVPASDAAQFTLLGFNIKLDDGNYTYKVVDDGPAGVNATALDVSVDSTELHFRKSDKGEMRVESRNNEPVWEIDPVDDNFVIPSESQFRVEDTDGTNVLTAGQFGLRMELDYEFTFPATGAPDMTISYGEIENVDIISGRESLTGPGTPVQMRPGAGSYQGFDEVFEIQSSGGSSLFTFRFDGSLEFQEDSAALLDTNTNERITFDTGATNLRGENGNIGLSVNDSANIIQTFVGKFDISPGNANLRLAEGTQIVDDDNDTIRFNISPNRTTIHDETGETVFKGNNGYAVQAITRSGTPFHIFDEEASTPAMRYIPDSDIGEFEFTNAIITNDVTFGSDKLENNNGLVKFGGHDTSTTQGHPNVHIEMMPINSSAAGAIAFNAGTNNSAEARIRARNTNGIEMEADNTSGRALTVRGDVKVDSGSNLIIDSNQEFQLFDGTKQIFFGSQRFSIADDEGTERVTVRGNPGQAAATTLRDQNSNNIYRIESDGYTKIQDTEEDVRLLTNDVSTWIGNGNGLRTFDAQKSKAAIRIRNGQPFDIDDATNDHRLVQTTVGNPGTVELKNAKIVTNGNKIISSNGGAEMRIYSLDTQPGDVVQFDPDQANPISPYAVSAGRSSCIVSLEGGSGKVDILANDGDFGTSAGSNDWNIYYDGSKFVFENNNVDQIVRIQKLA